MPSDAYYALGKFQDAVNTLATGFTVQIDRGAMIAIHRQQVADGFYRIGDIGMIGVGNRAGFFGQAAKGFFERIEIVGAARK